MTDTDPFIEAKYADMTEKITKDEVIEFYKTYIHPSSPNRTKLSIFMHSQVKRESTVKLSTTAFEAFLKELELAQLPTADLEYASSLGADAPVAKAVEFFSKYIDKYDFIPEEKKTELLDKVKELATLHAVSSTSPASQEDNAQNKDEGTLREGTIVIEDLFAFKRTLENATLPVPVVSFEPERI